ncbi:MAG: GNAT family N-acetyltransferase [Actinomycetota bacterium]
MNIQIREATPEEYAEAGAVTASAYREFVRGGDWEDYLESIADVEGRADRTTIVIALDGTRIVGSATLELTDRVEPDDDPALDPAEAHVRMLGVAPEARRRGIARALMADCMDRARAGGKTFLTLHTTDRMAAAQRMYESLGFVRGSDRVFPDGFVLLTYRAEL